MLRKQSLNAKIIQHSNLNLLPFTQRLTTGTTKLDFETCQIKFQHKNNQWKNDVLQVLIAPSHWTKKNKEEKKLHFLNLNPSGRYWTSLSSICCRRESYNHIFIFTFKPTQFETLITAPPLSEEDTENRGKNIRVEKGTTGN